jgi:O-Antigen ligase
MAITSLVRQRSEGLVVAGLVLTTIAVTPFSNFDPINPIKQFILAATSFGLLGLVWTSFFTTFSKPLRFIVAIYLISLCAPFIFAESPTPQQLWGTFGRNTGLLTYISAAILITGCAALSSKSFLNKFFRAGISTIAFLSIYGFIQSNNLDPIKWSAQDVFATLGNVNFLSALLGFASVPLFTVIFYSHISTRLRTSLSCILVFSLYIVVKTDSVQGIIVFVAGAYLTTLLYLYKRESRIFKTAAMLFSVAGISLGYLGVLGLAANGPLGTLLYQNTNVFRADYMGTAWRTFTNHFLTGVGYDGFDSWYRSDRGFISAYRTTPARTTNSAHNVILDVANNGGIFLVGSYLALLVATFIVSIRRISKYRFDPYFIGLFGGWLAYVLQSTISINQIGVSIWGWVATGILLGSARWVDDSDARGSNSASTNQSSTSYKKMKRLSKKPNQLLPAGIALRTIAMASLGMVLAFIPLKADADFQQARKRANLNEMMAASKSVGATAFHLSMTLDAALKNNFQDQAKEISDDLISRFPREFYGWQVRLQLQNIPQSEREIAFSKLRELDPFFACASANPSGEIRSWFDELPNVKKFELLRWWGVIPFEQKLMPSEDNWLAPLEEAIRSKTISFCGR